jgi:hypothetical protein
VKENVFEFSMYYLVITFKLVTLFLAAVAANGGDVEHAHTKLNECPSVKASTFRSSAKR